MGDVLLFHGSNRIVELPAVSKGKIHNDYGQGFYCTQDEHMAGEWACKFNTDGYVNRYVWNTEGLRILNLCDGTHNVLEWIALLLQNRTFKLEAPVAAIARDYVVQHFSTDLTEYDAVVGYRADDSYFQYATAFVSNSLPLGGLSKALRLGNLGVQTALISEKACGQLRFIEAQPARRTEYYARFLDRDTQARNMYKTQISDASFLKDDIFVLDIIREEMTADDARIQRIVSE